MKIDENSCFREILVDVNQPWMKGAFRLVRATGSLAYAPCLFVVDEKTGRVWPMTAVVSLLP